MVFITAEIGTSWQGRWDNLQLLVESLKEIGFNAVKFQALSVEKVVRHTELDYYEDASVTPENIERIDDICKKLKLEWYCTPTYPDAIEFLDPFVNRYKISVADITNKKLIDKVYSSGKQVLISSQKPLKDIKGKATRVKNLYCIPNYPTNYHDINFDLIPQFDGYSNHCQNPMAILSAVERGAEFIEMHVTPTRDRFLIDNNVAFDVLEAYDIVRWIRYYENWNRNSSTINGETVPQQGASSSSWKTYLSSCDSTG